MSMRKGIIVGEPVWEDSGVTITARISGWDGDVIAQADITAITYVITNLNTGDVVVVSTALVVADTVFNTLQTPAIWSEDSTGFNFKHHILHTVFTAGYTKYAVEYIFDPAASGEGNFPVYAEVCTRALHRS